MAARGIERFLGGRGLVALRAKPGLGFGARRQREFDAMRAAADRRGQREGCALSNHR
jgi:hypothetical protein